MALLGRLAHRQRQPEIMDEPDLDPRLHDQALNALERINVLSRPADVVWPHIAALARQSAPRPIRVLDLGCGAGDVAIELWRRATRSQLDIAVAGCDISTNSIRYARERAGKVGANVEFLPLDVLNSPLPNDYDVMICSLFLHHLDEQPAVELLRRMGQAARLVLVNDLERSRVGYVLAWLLCRLLSRSHVVHTDGPRSVEGAFSVTEARQMAEQAGLSGATVRRCWPWRFLLRWERLEKPL
jgi:SAM-dependent methyltransferase